MTPMETVETRRYGNFSKFEIRPTENGHEVFLNGNKIPYVKHVNFDLGADQIATVTVQLLVSEMDCEYKKKDRG